MLGCFRAACSCCREKVKKAIALTFSTRLLASLLGMGTGILIARLLGPTGRGEYFLAITIIGMAQQFGALGLHSSNVYQVAANHELFPRLATNSLLVSWFVGIAGFPILLLTLPRFFPSVDLLMAVLIALAVGPSLYYLLMSNLLLGVDRVKQFNGFELLSRLYPLFFIGVFLVFSDLTPRMAVVASVLALLASAMVVAYFAQPRQRLKMDWPLFKGAINYGLRAYLAAILGFMLSRAGGLLLGLQDKVVEVGHLSVALQLADFMIMLPATVGLILFPKLVGKTQGRGQLTLSVVKILAGLMAVGCVMAWLLADLLIPLVFGDDFRGSVSVFQYMLPGIFALSLTSVVSQYLAAHGIPWALITSWTVGFLLMIGISWLLIPTHGAGAVAIAMSVSYGAVFVLLSYLAIRQNLSTSGQP